MKRLVTISALVLLTACSTVQNMSSGDHLRNAALKAIGAERVAWLSHDAASLPRGVESVTSLKSMRAYINDINAGSGTATVTYWYTGTFSTPEGQREGTLTIQRRLHFSKSDSGAWTQSGPAEEIARNSSWSSEQRASS
ncbi:MAG TPA: hypothetical protein VL284_02630 [Thermoanaerobaculia bacterium]|nr:hypothetical protein [Thermoanaerobaculia bacterium]